MDSLTDYYTLLGITSDATPGEIKSAFKKCALKYHPDVYKGEDAHERMRLLLLAYKTLNDPVARQKYDQGGPPSRQQQGSQAYRPSGTHTSSIRPTASPMRSTRSEVSPNARRDRQRYYDFPDVRLGHVMHIDLIDTAYTLAADEAQYLLQQGMIRGYAPETENHAYFCHRCHHRWDTTSVRGEAPRYCPKCKTTDWPEYLLLRCVRCCAVFESEQIRYEIGLHTYGKGSSSEVAALCPPYELFPLCPYCGQAHWCPAEDARVQALRSRVAQRAAMTRMLWISIVVLLLVVGGVLFFGILR